MVLFGVLVIILGIFLLIFGLDEVSPVLSLTGGVLFLVGICLLMAGCDKHSKRTVVDTQDNRIAPLNASTDNASSDTNQTSADANATATDSSNNTTTDDYAYAPPPDSSTSDADAKKYWDKWTNHELNRQTTIGCKDGVQVVVFGSVDDNGYTKWSGGYVRVHPDGKPFTCSESKDPTKELQS